MSRYATVLQTERGQAVTDRATLPDGSQFRFCQHAS